MIRPKQKHIDNMLRQAFREEAEKIASPPGDKLWAELQSRLDPHKIPELEEKAGLLLAKETAEKKYNAYSFWRKHRYLAGIAAACFLTIVVAASTVPSSGMKYLFTEILTFVQGNKVNMEMGIQSDEAGQADLMESEDQTLQRSLTLGGTEEGLGSGPLPGEGGKESSIKGAVEVAPMQIESYGVTFDSGETILFTDEETFLSSLRKSKILSPDEIWQIKGTPEGFRFKNAGITKTESYLINVFQEYEGDDGQRMTLVQEFFHDEGKLDIGITTADSLTNPIQVGRYSGHLLRQHYGFHMVIWIQDNSRVTLSGQLGEEELFEVLNSLEK
ncbi:MAG: DUF4367 domain-containing protein [Bacillota bacterium]|nr:DUF4367 domain-containing protein [Bacillota bacterium]